MANFEGPGMVVVRSPDHSKAVINALRNLFDSKRGTNFEFRWNGSSVKAHRTVLELFLSQDVIGPFQQEHNVARIKQEVSDDNKDQSNDILETLLEFLYKGEVAVSEEQLGRLLVVAKELDFQLLVDAISQTDCSKNIEVNNLLEIKLDLDTGCSENEFSAEDLLARKLDDEPGNSSCSSEYLKSCLLNRVPRMPVSEPSILAGQSSARPYFKDTLLELAGSQRGPSFCKKNCQNLEHSADPRCSSSGDLSNQAVIIKEEPEEILPDEHYSGSEGSADEATMPNDLMVLQYSDEEDDQSGEDAPDDNPGGDSVDKEDVLSKGNATTSKEGGQKMYKCPHCEYESPNYFTRTSHLARIHGVTISGSAAKVHKCNQCHYTSFKLFDLKTHLQSKHSEFKRFSCPHCGLAMKHKRSLSRHLNIVHGLSTNIVKPPKVYKCSHCNFEAPKWRRFNYHCISFHGLTVKGQPAPKFQCSACDYSSFFTLQLKSHWKFKHAKHQLAENPP